MKSPTFLYFLLFIIACPMFAQSNFVQLLESEDPVSNYKEIDAKAAEELHHRYLLDALTDEDTIKQIVGNVFLYSDNLKKRDFEEASRYILTSENLAIALKNKSLIGWVNHKKGALYVYIRDFENAIKYYSIGASTCLEANDSLCLALSFEQLSSMHGQMKQFDSAQYYFELAEPLLESHADDNSLCVSLINYGNLLNYQNKDEEALTYLLRAAELTKKLDNKYRLVQLNHNLAELYLDLGDLDQALELYELCIKTNKENNWPERLLYNYNGMSRLYSITGDDKLALQYYKLYDNLEDSVITSKLKLEIANLESKNELGQKEILLEQTQTNLQAAKLKIQKILLVSLILSFLLLAGLYHWQSTLRQTKLKAIENKKNLNKLTQLLANKNRQIAELDTALTELKNENIPIFAETNPEENIYNSTILTDSDWLEFKASFEATYPKFITRVYKKYDNISEAELRLFMFIKMRLNTKDISSILGISPESVKKTRYRLRKRINLQEKESLEEIVYAF